MTWGSAQIVAILPLVILSATIVIALLVSAFVRGSQPALIPSVAGLVLASASLPFAAAASPGAVTPLLVLDD